MPAIPHRKKLLLVIPLALLLVAGVFATVQRRGGGATVQTQAADVNAIPTTRPSGTDKSIITLQSRLSKKASDPNLLARLASAYLQKARETANPTYYSKTEAVLNQILKTDPENGDALTVMGTLALARHQFGEALDWGQRAMKANPSRASNYGIVGDALVELGRYDEAVATVQKMVDTRPDLSSYSRVSYIRELYGRVDDAIQAMELAISAGGPAVENTAYLRVQLGNIYFNTGRLDEAERQYTTTLERSPGYGVAQAGLAYVKAARGDDAAAIDLFTKASESMPLAEYFIALGDLYARNGRTEEANQQYGTVRVIERLFRANGVDMDAETALFLADHNIELPSALEQARGVYARRQSIFAADVLAWTLYKMGRPEEAEGYAQQALRLGTKDALKLYHAGMIAKALGKTDEAKGYLEQALALNPNFSILWAADAKAALASLGGSVPAAAARSTP